MIKIGTRTQTASLEWEEERRCRMTSSRFGEICKITERRDRESLCMQIISPKSFSTHATSHRIRYETVAKKTYEEQFGQSVDACGLVVSQSHPYLASSPDGLVREDIVLEVKCPYKMRNCYHSWIFAIFVWNRFEKEPWLFLSSTRTNVLHKTLKLSLLYIYSQRLQNVCHPARWPVYCWND